jgi:hypothetical protein
MINFSKIHFPELHFNPINRDLIFVITIGFFVATAIVAVGVMIASQF